MAGNSCSCASIFGLEMGEFMRKRVAVCFGGKSSEHEISVISARNVANAIDNSKWEILLIAISQEGSWHILPGSQIPETLKVLKKNDFKDEFGLWRFEDKVWLFNLKNPTDRFEIDLIFPVMHGQYSEDGTIQGLFKMVDVAFVGPDVLASAVGMDKHIFKQLILQAGLLSAQYSLLERQSGVSIPEAVSRFMVEFSALEKKLGLPFFVKPARQGSSVGVRKVRGYDEFEKAIAEAFKFDTKVLIEEFISGQEIECSVRGLSQTPESSRPGRVIPQHEFYSFDAKYIDADGAHFQIPAHLDAETEVRIRQTAEKVYKTVGCDGLTRVDMFLTQDKCIYINEINTMPGFTGISMYPKMWEASGVSYRALVDSLIDLAFEKQVFDRTILNSRL